jgi:hypothetical protein
MGDAAGVLVPLGGMAMIIVLVLGIPMIRLMSKRLDARIAVPPLAADAIARLERIEHAIDAMSVEVERIAEGQRFTTKLLSERASDRELAPRAAGGGQGR